PHGSAFHLPDGHPVLVVGAGRHHALAVGAERHEVDVPLLSQRLAHGFVFLDVPHLGRPFRAGGPQQAAVGAQDGAPNLILVVDGTHGFPRCDVPNDGRLVRGGRRDVAPVGTERGVPDRRGAGRGTFVREGLARFPRPHVPDPRRAVGAGG